MSAEPSPDCPLCPSLHGFIAEWRMREPAWFNAPVADLPGIRRRREREGCWSSASPRAEGGQPDRTTILTGDYAGDLLYSTLIRHGFATGSFEARPDDGLQLVGAAIITNAVRCVPPRTSRFPSRSAPAGSF